MGQSTNGKKFELVLESENVGAWMAINNAFSVAWGDPPESKDGRSPADAESYWNGILVQLGRFRRILDDELLSGFTAIEFSYQKNPVGTLLQKHFTEGIVWLNIVYAKHRQPPAYPRDFRKRLKLGEIKTEIVERAKPLHHYLLPFPGGITLWPENGYSIDAKIEAKNGTDVPRHVSHTFHFDMEDPGALRVELLRLDRKDCRWTYAEKLPQAEGEKPDWRPCYDEHDNLYEQELKAQKGSAIHVLADPVDRIAVTQRSVGTLGQQIGKNPPQN